jgi:class 3 adenylate cyclase
LLLNVLPESIASRLKDNDMRIADSHEAVTILFADIVDFTKMTSSMPPAELVDLLSQIFSRFDKLAYRYGLEKIKTIGDSYMAVCGLSVPYLDPDRRAVDFAKEMQSIVRRFQQERGLPLSIAIGINSGDIVAGLVGRNRFIYDVWGETINQASDLKSACLAGEILVSETVHARLQDLYEFE